MSVAEVLCSTRQSTTHSFFSFNSRECDYHTEERSQMQLDLALLRWEYLNTLTRETFFLNWEKS